MIILTKKEWDKKTKTKTEALLGILVFFYKESRLSQ